MVDATALDVEPVGASLDQRKNLGDPAAGGGCSALLLIQSNAAGWIVQAVCAALKVYGIELRLAGAEGTQCAPLETVDRRCSTILVLVCAGADQAGLLEVLRKPENKDRPMLLWRSQDLELEEDLQAMVPPKDRLAPFTEERPSAQELRKLARQVTQRLRPGPQRKPTWWRWLFFWRSYWGLSKGLLAVAVVGGLLTLAGRFTDVVGVWAWLFPPPPPPPALALFMADDLGLNFDKDADIPKEGDVLRVEPRGKASELERWYLVFLYPSGEANLYNAAAAGFSLRAPGTHTALLLSTERELSPAEKDQLKATLQTLKPPSLHPRIQLEWAGQGVQPVKSTRASRGDEPPQVSRIEYLEWADKVTTVITKLGPRTRFVGQSFLVAPKPAAPGARRERASPDAGEGSPQ